MSWLIEGMGVSRRFRIVMSLVFAFGTIVWYSAQAGSSWHFAHVVATFFMLLAIRPASSTPGPDSSDCSSRAAVLARLPLILAAPFFIAYLADRTIREETDDPTTFGALGADRPPVWQTRPTCAGSCRSAGRSALLALFPLVEYLIYD